MCVTGGGEGLIRLRWSRLRSFSQPFTVNGLLTRPEAGKIGGVNFSNLPLDVSHKGGSFN